ncbi:sigma-54-dependent Fis family transcriptional regulator [Collimonas sp.]|jgi:transcriptional regulator of acetoin/glycerol metabolism|uniref:sigma-54-dependent Fis family transcriptional regulator n=1 Tax=Collimonas sp. TaxID=1963772 RepID=UPI002B95FEDC|nr:sigma-54-dependent Fis family transcriptional regulator [Collimonas sp.]HWW05365.1 sigma-54-dependent Fis family transcriptional regulator [Collimonas sp.]
MRDISCNRASDHLSCDPAVIEKSHQRSTAFGLGKNDKPDILPLDRSSLSMLLEQNRTLHLHALPVMETLYEQIVNTHNMVILTDAHGVIVHALGDDDFLIKANRVALNPGVTWSEQSKGTNAIGTAIAERAPTTVHADAHYLSANHFLTCSAAPIFDYQGNILGVLDVSGDRGSYHKHTMALVRMSAQMIENQLFTAAFENAVTLHFHSRPEFIGTLVEGIACFTPGGRFLSANRSALFQLGLPQTALQSHTFSSLFGLPLSTLFDHYRAAAPGLLNLCLHSGVKVYARAELRLSNSVFQHYSELPAMAETVATATATAATIATTRPKTAPRRLSSLRYLNTGDPHMAALIGKLDKVIGRDIPILITGETGTGKELLAQAVHNDSPRKNNAFVAVNCASIPETLIESELFGYEEGAFTGARKKGGQGKLLQANGGTLFLDEIGDMPLSLQARLLRVLQERVVTPLGSTKSIPVNLAVICATNRNLRELIAANLFREDLYYRLNGLVVKLPALRERSDLDVIVERLLAETENEGGCCSVAPDIMALFRRHSWPGNFRQLSNLLRTAVVMAGDDRIIKLEHLPDDFLEDVQAEQPLPASVIVSPAAVAAAANDGVGSLEDLALAAVKKAFEASGGNVSATAKALGVSRNTVYRKLRLR